MKMMSASAIEAMRVIAKNGRKFYASDYNINGGTINGLAYRGLIQETGKTKFDFIEVDEIDHLYKKVEVYEWEISLAGMKMVIDDARKTAESLLAMADELESLR